jgi:hypothetical protein
MGALMYESMIFRCRSVTFLAAVAGGIKCGHTYQFANSGSTPASGLRYKGSECI